MKSFLIGIALLALFARAPRAMAEDDPPADDAEKLNEDDDAMFNWRTKTLGGKQLWTDVQYFHGWHIQRHVWSGHYRLLDPEDRRLTWGTEDACREELAEIRADQPAMQGRAVILLHGLFRSKGAMKPMQKFLETEGEYTVVRLGYPSTRNNIDAHAEALKSVIDHLDGITQIDLVGHSLGNLVIRRYLAITTDTEKATQGDLRLGRIVMLAPPNHGSSLGEKLVPLDFTKQIAGESALAITDWDALEKKLVVPRVPFGIVAGGKGDDEGYNPLIPGDDDMVVEVASTRLVGAADFRVVPALHTFIMNEPLVHRMTLHFLRHGSFDPLQGPRPIREEAVEADD